MLRAVVRCSRRDVGPRFARESLGILGFGWFGDRAGILLLRFQSGTARSPRRRPGRFGDRCRTLRSAKVIRQRICFPGRSAGAALAAARVDRAGVCRGVVASSHRALPSLFRGQISRLNGLRPGKYRDNTRQQPRHAPLHWKCPLSGEEVAEAKREVNARLRYYQVRTAMLRGSSRHKILRSANFPSNMTDVRFIAAIARS